MTFEYMVWDCDGAVMSSGEVSATGFGDALRHLETGDGDLVLLHDTRTWVAIRRLVAPVVKVWEVTFGMPDRGGYAVRTRADLEVWLESVRATGSDVLVNAVHDSPKGGA